MDTIVVGDIQGYDVLYIPEKNYVFCKNTVLPVDTVKAVLKGNLDRFEVPSKNLVISLDRGYITFGCLSTTIENCNNIINKINKLRDSYGKQN